MSSRRRTHRPRRCASTPARVLKLSETLLRVRRAKADGLAVPVARHHGVGCDASHSEHSRSVPAGKPQVRPAHWRRVRAAIALRRRRRAPADSWRVSSALPTFRHRAFATAPRPHSLYARPEPDFAARCDSDTRAGSFSGIWRTAGWFEAAFRGNKPSNEQILGLPSYRGRRCPWIRATILAS
jgi:hypothetical protein